MRDFSALVDTVTAGNTIDPKALAKALRIPANRLAKVCRVHENTVSRTPSSPKLQKALARLLAVIAASPEKDLDMAILWFRLLPVPEFGHRPAIQIVEAGQGPELLEHLRQPK